MAQRKSLERQPVHLEGDSPIREAAYFRSPFDTKRWLSCLKTSVLGLFNNGTPLPLLLRKPSLLGLWFATARRAQIGLGVVLFLLVFVVPPWLDALTSQLYPSITPRQTVLQRAFGRVRTVPDPRRDVRYNQFLVTTWVIGLGVVIVLLLDHLPETISIGRQRAAGLSAEAEKVACDDPGKSARLYRSARGLLIEEAQQAGCVAAAGAHPQADKTTVILPGDGPAIRPKYLGAGRRYRLQKVLGSGGMGVVHAGYDTVLKRPVALKQLFGHLVQDAEQTDRFRQEALALASLTHAHIVTIYDLLEEAGHFWIVMELLTGGNLAEEIAGGKAKSVSESIAITCDVASGLDYAHQRGIVHRDVKPMNILFTADRTPKLTDFGNAKLNESIVHTQEGMLLGSPAYMSPEQITGAPVDYRGDIYALGVSLYQMLTGKVPFEGDLSTILAQHVTQPPRKPSDLNPAVSDGLDAVVLTMLSKPPADRFQGCGEAIAALRAAVA